MCFGAATGPGFVCEISATSALTRGRAARSDVAHSSAPSARLSGVTFLIKPCHGPGAGREPCRGVSSVSCCCAEAVGVGSDDRGRQCRGGERPLLLPVDRLLARFHWQPGTGRERPRCAWRRRWRPAGPGSLLAWPGLATCLAGYDVVAEARGRRGRLGRVGPEAGGPVSGGPLAAGPALRPVDRREWLNRFTTPWPWQE